MRPRSGSSAKARLLTVLGELVLPHGGAVWTSTVVDALALCDVDERNARQALARLAEQGVVRSEKQGRRARWHLTDAGRRLLVEGTERIYALGTGDDRWDGRWLVVLCSVPEDQRAKRHQLRTRLEFAGFGFVAPGVAICPHVAREQAAEAVLAALDLRRHARRLLRRLRDGGAGAFAAARRRALRRPRRPGPRVATVPVPRSGDPGSSAAGALARAVRARPVRRAPRRLVTWRGALVPHGGGRGDRRRHRVTTP
jgi:DNA-binding transcriptional ArsR family regulator